MRTAIVYNFLLEATLMASIAILLMIPIRMFLRKQLGSRVLTFGWLLVAIRLLCPLALPNPAIHTIRSSFAPDAAIRPIAGQIKVRLTDAINLVNFRASLALGDDSGIAQSLNTLAESTWNGMLSIRLMQLYLIGFCIVLAWFLLSNARFRAKMRSDRIEPISGKLLEEYQTLCKQRNVKPIPVWFVDPLPSACLVGVFKPYIALPLSASPQDALQVLQHEVCHYRARDHWWGLIRLACCAVHWFNPLVWVAAHMSRTDIELSCDERVTHHMDDSAKKAYAHVLVLAAARRNLPGVAVLSTGMSMTGRKLKSRIASILSGKQASKGLALAFVLLSSMALIGAFATAESFPIPKLPVTPEAEVQFQQREVAGSSSFEKDTADVIAYAKEIWEHPYVNGGIDNLNWQMSIVRDHMEVSAYRQNGEAVFHTAFLKNGKIIYLCNLASGDREAFVTDNPHYENQPALMQEIKQQAAEAAKALSPTLDVDLASLTFGSEGDVGDCRFLNFEDTRTMPEGMLRWAIRMQVEPEVRVSYFIDHNHFTSDDADRLEPGNG